MRVPAFLNGLKPPIKRFRHRARSAYINFFHSFTPAEFREMLRGLGVRAGDVLCVHSSFDQFLGFQGNVGEALQAIKDSVGPEGGILMPTQPFTTTAIEYVRTHPVTDLARTLVAKVLGVRRRQQCRIGRREVLADGASSQPAQAPARYKAWARNFSTLAVITCSKRGKARANSLAR